MLLTKRKSFNPSRVVKLHRRPHRHRSFDNHNLSLQKSYTGPTRIVRLSIRPSNKISAPKDNKVINISQKYDHDLSVL
ncbi:unnamed protein product [Adineta steineri]|uniref:Uncharacterized protein n=1 Tax=Adineta steineri TaxID=433720 RepID=A0A813WQY7_9BILA|nr:unnamed protein product [Adineta steineri]